MPNKFDQIGVPLNGHNVLHLLFFFVENPFPQQGAVITIKLSEEILPQGDQHVLVEMLFEMNYDTGHWRRLKRTRVMQQNANS